MKKFIFFVLILAGAWNHFSKNIRTSDIAPAMAVTALPEQQLTPVTAFSCDGRQYCSQMTSRAEAEYFVQHCPDTKMDGDHDGIPCENDTRF